MSCVSDELLIANRYLRSRLSHGARSLDGLLPAVQRSWIGGEAIEGISPCLNIGGWKEEPINAGTHQFADAAPIGTKNGCACGPCLQHNEWAGFQPDGRNNHEVMLGDCGEHLIGRQWWEDMHAWVCGGALLKRLEPGAAALLCDAVDGELKRCMGNAPKGLEKEVQTFGWVEAREAGES